VKERGPNEKGKKGIGWKEKKWREKELGKVGVPIIPKFVSRL